MNPEWFGDRLRELRAEKGWTQQQLADAAELSVDAVRDLEQGRRRPSWATVAKFCTALGVECTAFSQPPAKRHRPRLGRPKKQTEAEPAAEPRPKRRSRKGRGG